MIKLYGKIFIGFWLAMLTVLGSWMIAGEYLNFQPDVEEAEVWQQRRPAPRVLHSLHYAIQNMPEARLQPWLEKQQRERDIKIFLLNKAGLDLFQRKLPDNIKKKAKRLLKSRPRGRALMNDSVIITQPVFRPESGQLTMLVILPRPQSTIVQLLVKYSWLRLLFAMLISALICYGLSRYLTRPLQALSLATRRFAEGDLDARINVPPKGGDETTELARDFNSMAAQLKDQIEAQKRLLHDVSHELRSPLARLRVATTLATDDVNLAQQLTRIDREISRLDSLIGQLLVVPDIHANLEDSIDLVALLRELSEDANFESEASARRVELVCSVDEVLVATHDDLLHRAFDNIIRNALHYSNPGSVVLISIVNTCPGLVRIDIEDQGPGVPTDQLPQIFDAFFRVDAARQRSTGGHGLGLSIAKRAVEVHGGSIAARNSREGLIISVELNSLV
jgi:signal transduction histidine kinase